MVDDHSVWCVGAHRVEITHGDGHAGACWIRVWVWWLINHKTHASVDLHGNNNFGHDPLWFVVVLVHCWVSGTTLLCVLDWIMAHGVLLAWWLVVWCVWWCCVRTV